MTHRWNPIFFCWLVLVVMLLSSTQITLLSIDPMSDPVRMLTDHTGGEETKETETEDQTTKREFDHAQIMIPIDQQMSLSGYPDSFDIGCTEFTKIFYPPPEG